MKTIRFKTSMERREIEADAFVWQENFTEFKDWAKSRIRRVQIIDAMDDSFFETEYAFCPSGDESALYVWSRFGRPDPLDYTLILPGDLIVVTTSIDGQDFYPDKFWTIANNSFGYLIMKGIIKYEDA